jgi:hypothetical protein
MDLERTTVAEIMTKAIVTCSIGTATSKARRIMASNHIRHLPVVDNGVVIGILSARDLMGQQLIENRAAAEEVTMLSVCLKSIDLNEAADTVTEEAPKLFQAAKCVLCLWNSDDCKLSGGSGALISYNQCLCPKEHINTRTGIEYQTSSIEDSVPDDCEKAGAQGPRLVIPLEISTNPSDVTRLSWYRGSSKKQLSGYLCMCGLAHSSTVNRELTLYKAKLTREMLLI